MHLRDKCTLFLPDAFRGSNYVHGKGLLKAWSHDFNDLKIQTGYKKNM